MEYGYYLWQFGNNMEHGLSLLKEAAKLAPNDPSIHAILGLVYSNNTGNAYSVNQAIAELKRAAQLEPNIRLSSRSYGRHLQTAASKLTI